MSKSQKANGTVIASFCKDGYWPYQTSAVFTPGNRPWFRGLIGNELSPDIEFLPSLADKSTPLPPVY